VGCLVVFYVDCLFIGCVVVISVTVCGLVVVRSFDRLFVYFFVIILLVSVIVTVGCLCLMGLEYRVG